MLDRAVFLSENDRQQSLLSRGEQEESKNQHANGTQQGNKTIIQNPFRKNIHNITVLNALEEYNSQKPLDVFLMTSFDEKGKQRHPGIRICTHPHLKLTEETLTNQNKMPKYERNMGYYQGFDEEHGYEGTLSEIDTKQGNHGLLSYYSDHVKGFDKIKMLICVTMYAEERSFLEATLQHIYNNVEVFQREARVHESQIAVVVLQDGIMKMKQETVDFYSDIDENLGRPCHLQNRRNIIDQQIKYFKYTNQQVTLDSNSGFPTTIPSQTSLLYQNQIQFDEEQNIKVLMDDKNYNQNNMNFEKGGLIVFSAFKHLNSKKLSSHLWFFEGFCQQFKPKYCALVDVGTLPAKDGLVKFYMAMEGNDKIGGVCGFLGLEEPKGGEMVSERERAIIESSMKKKIKDQKHLIRDEWQNKKKEKKQNEKYQSRQQQDNDDDYKDRLEEEREEKRKRIKDQKDKVNVKIYLILFPFTLIFIIVKKLIFDLIIYNIFYFIFKIFQYLLLGFLGLGSLKSAQLYEYTISHMIDKNFESFLGFLHVLPGAWSAYRYEALQVKFEGRETILQKSYLKQLLNPKRLEGNIYEANMFLAEDRILCLGLYCQPQKDYILKYIPDAYAFTDPVGSLEEFMSQRRRWINSTYYALDYVLKHYRGYVEESGHTSIQKKVILPFNMLFANLGKFNTYFLPAFYIFVALMCSFQFLNPAFQSGYYFYVKDGKYVCESMNEQPTPMCNPLVPQEENCYKNCSNVDNPNFAYTALNLVPAFFIITILSIIFASLVLKVKGGNKQLMKKIEEECLQEDEFNEIKRIQNELEQKIQEGQSKNILSENKRKELEVKYDQKIQKVKERKANWTINSLQKVKLENVHNLKRREFNLKKKVDSLKAEEFGITVFKVLAAIISINSLIIAGIVLIGVVLNIINEKNQVIIGFKVLSPTLKWYVISLLAANVLSFLINFVVHICPQYKLAWYIFKSSFSFTIYSPVYNHVLLIYAFCNVDDVTWGTKGLSKGSDRSDFYLNKVSFVGKWLILNGLFVTTLISINLFFGSTPYVMLAIGTYGTSYLFIKSMIATVNYLRYFCVEKRKYRKKVSIYNLSREKEEIKKDCIKEFNELRVKGGKFKNSNILDEFK